MPAIRRAFWAERAIEWACVAPVGVLLLLQASATVCRRALFLCRAESVGRRDRNPRREYAMGCSKAPASKDAQPYSDPDAAGVLWAGRLHGPVIQRQRDGTPADAWASPIARPMLRLIPHFDNRRFVQRRQVGQRDREWPPASSHSARCAAAGRRSGWFASQSWEARLDS